ncbi:hypothetical protein GCM10028792_09340 [Salinisphaera aquimarina]
MAPAIAAFAVITVSGCAITPDPIEASAIEAQAQRDMQTLAADQPPLTGLLSPEEAVSRALLYNRERHVRTMQTALRNHQLDAANFDMLPSLTASAGYTTRSEYSATESVPFVDGSPLSNTGPSSYSVAQEKERYTYGIDFTWSVLDFGLSYVRAKQKADEYLIAREEERKAIQNLAEEVRAAYWKSVSADRLLTKVGPLMTEVDESLDRSRQIGRERLSDPLNSYSYQRSLLDVKRSLSSLRTELVGAKERLASLMGLPPTTAINLPRYDSDALEEPSLKIDVDTMERTALLLRPEILSSHYRERISRNDVRAALLRMFPDLSFSAGYQYDDNSFLRYNDWTSAGAAVSYDLLNIFQARANHKAAKTAVEIADEQRLATSLAVLTQVHLAALDFQASERKLETAKEYLDVSRSISDLVVRQASTGSVGELQVIKERLNALVAELRRDLAYAQIQTSFARVFKTMGLDPYPIAPGDTPEQLASSLASRRAAWEDGQIAVVIRPIADQEPVLTTAQPDEPATFQFADDTFALAGDVNYQATMADGSPLPAWLSFDPATRTFSADADAPAQSVQLFVKARNQRGVYALDRFVLTTAPDRT